MIKSKRYLLIFFCLLKLTMHLLADYHSGFQGDELLHIETGRHLAWGYMEFPPLIGLLAFLQNLFNTPAIWVHHIFAHIASLLILVYVAKIVIEAGGGNRALFLVLLAVIIAPGLGRSSQLFQPVVFSQLFWVMSFYYLLRYVHKPGQRNLWLLTASCVAAFMVKYDAVFFLAGLSVLLLFRQSRQALMADRAWINMVVAGLVILPNLLWQVQHDYPALQMFTRLYETQLDKITRWDNFKQLLIDLNPVVTLLLFIPGIVYLIFSEKKIISTAVLISFALLVMKNGKAYYFFPLVLTILPYGGIALEKLSSKTFIPIAAVLLTGAVLIPFCMAVLPLKTYEATYKKVVKDVPYDEYYADEKWRTTMQQLKAVYDSLPAAERANCLIWGKHYGQAGAVNLFSAQYGLPKAFSYHGSFYTWSPAAGEMPSTIIGLSYRVGEFYQPFFKDIRIVRTLPNANADESEAKEQFIYILQSPNQDFGKMKDLFLSRIYE
jgi:hypothetical protein